MPNLQGWKDIASHLGKSVRTVQRWERDYQLPVHRIGREGGEIIWADSGEVDEWLRSNSSTPLNSEPPVTIQPTITQPSIESRRPFAAAVRLLPWGLFAAACLVAWPLMLRGRGVGPSDWRITNGQFEALSASGAVLWSRSFPGALVSGDYSRRMQERQGSMLLLDDVDGDGLNEVLLVIGNRQHGEYNGLHILEADGTDRVAPIRPVGTVTFGTDVWSGPWSPHRVWVVHDEGRPPAIYAAFIHLNQYPTMLLELDADGHERGRYWSDGYVRDVRHGRLRGEPVVLVGATNNDTQGASLAIFPRGRLRGAPPAVNPQYRCASCGDDLPLEFLLFPRRCIAKAEAGQSHVQQTLLDDAGQFLVYVTEGPVDLEGTNRSGVWYTLDSGLHVREALITSGLIAEHKLQHASGVLDHPLGARDEADLFPVLRWTGSGFEPLPRAPVRR